MSCAVCSDDDVLGGGGGGGGASSPFSSLASKGSRSEVSAVSKVGLSKVSGGEGSVVMVTLTLVVVVEEVNQSRNNISRAGMTNKGKAIVRVQAKHIRATSSKGSSSSKSSNTLP